VIDLVKGWFAAGVLPGIALPGIATDPVLSREWLTVACAIAATVGHVYPVWFEFRGGKGAATLLGVLLGASPALLVPVLAVWLATVMLTGFVGLGTMLGFAALPAYLLLRGDGWSPFVVFGLSMAAFVAYTHRGNIERMRAGTENRARRLWLLRPRGAGG
jgi:glycerol-3-phosphate acyltransferase PlsY